MAESSNIRDNPDMTADQGERAEHQLPHVLEEPDPPVEYTGPGDWGNQGHWGTFGNRQAWTSDRR